MGDLLAGKVALVTGASRGIGRAIAAAYAREGAAVALAARSQGALEELAAQLGGPALAVPADLLSADQIDACVDRVRRELGPIDILVNNAGDNLLDRFLDQDEQTWWTQIELGIRAPYRLTRAVLGSMIERGWGRIINVLSVNAKKAGGFMTAYATAKHGLLGMTRALAMEFARTNVTVNAICPGWFRTELTDRTLKRRSELFGVPPEKVMEMGLQTVPQRVIMEPEEIQALAVFLASHGAQRITGQAINIDGGMVMS